MTSEWRRDAHCAACGNSTDWVPSARHVPITPNTATSIAPEGVLPQIWNQLAGHAQRGHTTFDTLCRLLAKHFNTRFPDEPRDPPQLDRGGLAACLEWWPSDAIEALWRGHERNKPGGADAGRLLINLPIIVLRLEGLLTAQDRTSETSLLEVSL